MAIQHQGDAIHLFRNATADHAQATEAGNSTKGRKAYRQILESLRWLSAHSARQFLLPLLGECENDGTRLWAATYLLTYCEQEAIVALESIALKENIHGFSAQITLQEWRNGRLKFAL